MSYLVECSIMAEGSVENIQKLILDGVSICNDELTIVLDSDGSQLPMGKWGDRVDMTIRQDCRHTCPPTLDPCDCPVVCSVEYKFGLNVDPTDDWIKGFAEKYPNLNWTAWKVSESDREEHFWSMRAGEELVHSVETEEDREKERKEREERARIAKELGHDNWLDD